MLVGAAAAARSRKEQSDVAAPETDLAVVTVGTCPSVLAQGSQMAAEDLERSGEAPSTPAVVLASTTQLAPSVHGTTAFDQE